MQNSVRRSILCPNCRKLISIDEPLCPYCGISRPGSWWKTTVLNLLSLDAHNFIKSIIIVNAVFFAISVLLSSSGLSTSGNPLRFLATSNNILLVLGATGTIPIERLHRWWSLLSAGYLHGGILHLFFNMAALSQVGPLVLQEFGLYRTVILYTLGSVSGFLVSYFAGISFTIGASASLCALIGALLYYGKSRGGFFGQSLFKQLSGWVIGIGLFGLLVPGINNWGHGGGLVGGIVLGYLLGYSERNRETYFHKLFAAICMLTTGATLMWALLSTFYYLFLAAQ
jgi:rhomboid protease GluP